MLQYVAIIMNEINSVITQTQSFKKKMCLYLEQMKILIPCETTSPTNQIRKADPFDSPCVKRFQD